jgi:hypothetical protein
MKDRMMDKVQNCNRYSKERKKQEGQSLAWVKGQIRHCMEGGSISSQYIIPLHDQNI